MTEFVIADPPDDDLPGKAPAGDSNPVLKIVQNQAPCTKVTELTGF
jgi:hypothetical protein